MTITAIDVDDDDVSAAVSAKDLTGDSHEDDLFLSGLHESVNQEMVTED